MASFFFPILFSFHFLFFSSLYAALCCRRRCCRLGFFFFPFFIFFFWYGFLCTFWFSHFPIFPLPWQWTRLLFLASPIATLELSGHSPAACSPEREGCMPSDRDGNCVCSSFSLSMALSACNALSLSLAVAFCGGTAASLFLFLSEFPPTGCTSPSHTFSPFLFSAFHLALVCVGIAFLLLVYLMLLLRSARL